jgi:cytidylate kinase
LIPDAIDVRGAQSPERKEDGLMAFLTSGRPMVTKGKIAGQGLNYQHCARQAFVGRSFSYESWYQMVRRSWRFGQTRPVQVHLIVAEGEDQIGRVIDAKSEMHETMKASMRAASRRATAQTSAVKVIYNPTHTGRLPSWLSAA